MKIVWNKATWYSKLLALLVFGAAFLTGTLYGIFLERVRTRAIEHELQQKREIVNWLDRANLVRQAESTFRTTRIRG